MHDLHSPLLAACGASRDAFLQASSEVCLPDIPGQPIDESRWKDVVWRPGLRLAVLGPGHNVAELSTVEGGAEIRHLVISYALAHDTLVDLCYPRQFNREREWMLRRLPNLMSWQIYALPIEPPPSGGGDDTDLKERLRALPIPGSINPTNWVEVSLSADCSLSSWKILSLLRECTETTRNTGYQGISCCPRVRSLV
ncbi:hypothetical protein PG997_014808 [Apiospora hydei]|uniref:Uncharacterized protein n=1 Tax=Apiospora hydei TaxID=1337664 RepID=A0ABR1UUW0_9PEZI